ncbi:MAG: c-type cytochrome, partial [Bacteroidota bacterium]
MITCATLTVCLVFMAFYLPVPEEFSVENRGFCGVVDLGYYYPPQPTDSTYLAGEKVFKANCYSCHQMHKKVIGPALVGVFERRDSLWVIDATRNFPALIKRGDQTAIDLYHEYNKTEHTVFEE